MATAREHKLFFVSWNRRADEQRCNVVGKPQVHAVGLQIFLRDEAVHLLAQKEVVVEVLDVLVVRDVAADSRVSGLCYVVRRTRITLLFGPAVN